jgi:hypothetical protein
VIAETEVQVAAEPVDEALLDRLRAAVGEHRAVDVDLESQVRLTVSLLMARLRESKA